LAARLVGAPLADVVRAHRATLLSAAITLACSVPFFALLGLYEVRLEWNFVPPVLAVFLAIMSAVERRARPHPWTSVATAACVAAWLVYEVAKPGPWF
jgi:hypothetical protein